MNLIKQKYPYFLVPPVAREEFERQAWMWYRDDNHLPVLRGDMLQDGYHDRHYILDTFTEISHYAIAKEHFQEIKEPFPESAFPLDEHLPADDFWTDVVKEKYEENWAEHETWFLADIVKYFNQNYMFYIDNREEIIWGANVRLTNAPVVNMPIREVW